MMKMIIIGASGLVVAVGLTVGVMLFLNKKADAPQETAQTTAADSTKTAEHEKPAEHGAMHDTLAVEHPSVKPALPNETATHDSALDTALTGDGLSAGDMSAIDNIMANLQAVDVPADVPSTDTTTTQPTKSAPTTTTTATTAVPTDTSALAKRETALTQREKLLEERLKSLEKREQDVARKMLVIDQAQSSRIASLAKLYDSMEPAQAAQVMLGIDDQTIVLILPRMKTQNAAAVLGAFPPERASSLSMRMISIADEGQ